jgi:hypothetical protein
MALRAGHGVDVLLKIYAGRNDGEEEVVTEESTRHWDLGEGALSCTPGRFPMNRRAGNLG